MRWCKGGHGDPDPMEKHKLLLEILVQTSIEKQLDPLGPIASLGRFVRPSVKTNLVRTPLTKLSGSPHDTWYMYLRYTIYYYSLAAVCTSPSTQRVHVWVNFSLGSTVYCICYGYPHVNYLWGQSVTKTLIRYEPVHEISNNVVCATSKASDQPAHTRSLIRVFASRFSILWLLSNWLNTIRSV